MQQIKSKNKKKGVKTTNSSDEHREILLQYMDEKTLDKMLNKDSEDFKEVLEEFKSSIETLQTKLKPVLDKIKQTKDKNFAENNAAFEPIVTVNGMSYLEMKYNLMLSYCQFLSLYLLMKLDATNDKDLSQHPIIGRLVHIKLLFEKLRPLDQKLQYQINKSLRQAALAEAHVSDPNATEE